MLAAEKYDSSDPVNLGSGEEISDQGSRRARSDNWSASKGHIAWDTSKPNGQPRRKLDVTRARERLGFEATTSLAEGLKKTYAWMLGKA